MKRNWSDEELIKSWTLTEEELTFLHNRSLKGKLGVAASLKFLLIEGYFPKKISEFPSKVTEYLAKQLNLHSQSLKKYDWSGRSSRRHRDEIRVITGFQPFSSGDKDALYAYLLQSMKKEHNLSHLNFKALEWLKDHKIEPPSFSHLRRIVRSSAHQYEENLFQSLFDRLSKNTKEEIDHLLSQNEESAKSPEISLNDLKSDCGRISVKSVIREIDKLNCIDNLDIPSGITGNINIKRLQNYQHRVMGEESNELAKRESQVKYALIVFFCVKRREEIIDSLVDLFIQIVHRISVRSEKKVVKEWLRDLKSVHGKPSLLFRIADAAMNNPEGAVKEVIFPVVDAKILHDIIQEWKASGPDFLHKVHNVLRASYSNHYRRIVPLLLDNLEFHSNNTAHQPVLDALKVIKEHRNNRKQHFSLEEVPLEGIIKNKWWDLVVEEGDDNKSMVNRINYEICVLQALRERLRCKEIWVCGADRYRNPEKDLPLDFVEKREQYYNDLGIDLSPDVFISSLKGFDNHWNEK